jgi:hypothetical protein
VPVQDLSAVVALLRVRGEKSDVIVLPLMLCFSAGEVTLPILQQLPAVLCLPIGIEKPRRVKTFSPRIRWSISSGTLR